jgi:uncharacterized protein (TIGR00297 family)
MRGVGRRLVIGSVAAAAVARAARASGALTVDGAMAASAIGALVFTAGGIVWSSLLLLFFGTSSFLSRGPSPSSDPITEKSGPRDAWQVAANGGVPGALAFLSLAYPSPRWLSPFAAALASATADTWATEIGSRKGGPARLLTTGEIVPAGTSGGITWQGMGAALLGASLLGGATWLLRATEPIGGASIAVSGFLGCLCDSLLGATVQESRRCPSCTKRTEQRVHRTCGTATRYESGVRGLGNDMVNACSCAFAACSAPMVHAALRRLFQLR